MLHVVRRALLVVVVPLVLLPGVAEAWYVDISITGAGRVYETTDANEIDEHCTGYTMEGFASPSTTPTGSVGATCRAGDASGDYGSGWVVRYVAEPAAGYRFAGWASDGSASPGPVLCDGSNGSSSYSGTACQFATHQNLQTRARFVDDTNPVMSTLNGPNQVVNGPATFTFSAAADPTFRFFECRVGGVHEWQNCSSGREEDPPTGNYTFQVRGVDWSGNRSTEMTKSWTVDKIAPETTLQSSGPNGWSRSTSAQFEFQNNESGSFVCSLDGATPTACGSPKSYSSLGQGAHTFSVWARDAAGNVDPTPATRNFTVDTVAPNTTLASSGPTGPTNNPNAAFSFSSEANATFTCTLNGEESSCNSGAKTYNGLPDGAYTFTVTATDQAGNPDGSPAQRTFTVDTVAPNTTLASSGPNGPTNDPDATFTFSSDPNATFTCTLNGAETPCNSGTKSYDDLADGAYTFTVRATDQAGNPDGSPATRTFTLDTAAPETIIDSGPSRSTTSQTARFEFSSPEAGVTFRCSIDGAAPSSCSSPLNLSGLAVGTHTISVFAVDAAGNVDASPATRTWTVTSPPPPPPSTDSGGSGGSGTSTPSPGGGLPQPLSVASTNQPSAGGTAGTSRPRITGPSRGSARLDRRGRFTIPRLKVTCPARCTVSVRISGSTRRVTPSRTGTLRIRLSKKALAAVKRAKRRRMTVVVTVTPRAGGAKVTKRMTVTLIAPKR